jgi:hypothetical protein
MHLLFVLKYLICLTLSQALTGDYLGQSGSDEFCRLLPDGFQRHCIFLGPSDCVFGHFDIAALRGCHILNAVWLFVYLRSRCCLDVDLVRKPQP